jgi:hypothetical protein
MFESHPESPYVQGAAVCWGVVSLLIAWLCWRKRLHALTVGSYFLHLYAYCFPLADWFGVGLGWRASLSIRRGDRVTRNKFARYLRLHAGDASFCGLPSL